MEVIIEEILIYFIVGALIFLTVWIYLRKQKKVSDIAQKKIAIAKAAGSFEPISLHPVVDTDSCIKTGACISACPEKDILGIVHGKAATINASECIGHGACFHSCPVEAISLCIGTEKRGVDLPHIDQNFETNIPGIYIVGELGGMGLIKNAVEQGRQGVENIYHSKNHGNDSIDDILIVGAGPAGISAALNAKKNGLSFKILDQDTLGGTVFTFPRSKIVMTNPMTLPFYGKLKLFETTKSELLQIWNKILSEQKIDIIEKTKVESILSIEKGFSIHTNTGLEMKASNVILAIGRRGTPRKLNVPGEELEKVAYRLLDSEKIQDKDILVVGGGDSAIETALLLYKKNRVTLSYRKANFTRLKAKNKEKIKEAIATLRINIAFNTNVSEIGNDEIKLQDSENNNILVMKNDLVYIFAGGELPTTFLERSGIRITKRFGHAMMKK